MMRLINYMKKLFRQNRVRHLVRILCALIIALLFNHFAAQTKQAWLPMTTVLVMLTTTGSAVYQGLWRFFIISCVVVVGSLIFSSVPLLFMRMYDVVFGAIIGIVANSIILPDRVDAEYRMVYVPILKAYARYFSALVFLLLDKNLLTADKEKIQVENCLQTLPGWIYEPGFDSALQKGYRYFFMKVGQVGEILFSMHHLARFSYDEELLNVVREPLLQCVLRVEQFMDAMVKVLELKKLSEGIVDFGGELEEMESRFKKVVPVAMEATRVATDYVYLTEFIYDMRDLREALLRLTEALR